jgi:hypothetical protein
MSSHLLENRLIASRDKVNWRYKLTNDYVSNFMKYSTVEVLTFHILYTNGQTPPFSWN